MTPGKKREPHLRWLIVEDALRDRKGHWFEYLSTFFKGLQALGDRVVILSDRQAEPFIEKSLDTWPALPASIWHRMGDGAGALRRYLRVPQHAWNTYRALRRHFRRDSKWDVIFVPTVLVHHLLGWYWLIRWMRRRMRSTRVILFFPNLPITLTEEGKPIWNPSPTTKLMRSLFEGLRQDVLSCRVVIGVETHEMGKALSKLIQMPVIYFPHPVEPLHPAGTGTPPAEMRMSCYGPGRPEKGSDILVDGIEKSLTRDGIRSQFEFQWLGDFQNMGGRAVTLPGWLDATPAVRVIKRYFKEGEYAQHLLQTSVMLLPYRRSSYGLRVSRVLIEALVNGIPVITTERTTLATQMARYGAGFTCEDGSAESLATAISAARDTYPALRAQAQEKQAAAIEHFSVAKFRRILIEVTW